MSIAEKLITIAENEQKVYKSGQLATLKNSKYMNPTLSGTIISAKDVNPIEHDVDLVVKSKNLLPTPYDFGDTTTVNGVTFTTNADGSITINGTATETISFCISDNKARLETGKHYFSVQEELPSGLDILVYYLNSNGMAIQQCYLTTTTISAPYPDNYKALASAQWIIKIASGTALNNVVIKPMIEKGETATEYVPYSTNGVTVSRYGKNLLPYPYYDVTRYGNILTTSGITYTVNDDGSFTVVGTATANANYTFIPASYDTAMPLKAGTYTVSIGTPNTEQIQFRLGTMNASGAATLVANFNAGYGLTEKTFTLSEDSRIYFNAIVGRGKTIAETTFYPQLELGETATDYEPYIEPTVYTATADGTVEGVKSISPSMTLIPNNNAVTVECEYLRDIDLYIDNLLKSVAMIGGE